MFRKSELPRWARFLHRGQHVAVFAKRNPAAWAGVVTIGILLAVVQTGSAAGTRTPPLLLEPTAKPSSTTVRGSDRFIRMCRGGFCSLVHTKERLDSEPVPARVLLPHVPSHAFITLFQSGTTTSAQVGHPLPSDALSVAALVRPTWGALVGAALALTVLVTWSQVARRHAVRMAAAGRFSRPADYRNPECPDWARIRAAEEVEHGPEFRDAGQSFAALAVLWLAAAASAALTLL